MRRGHSSSSTLNIQPQPLKKVEITAHLLVSMLQSAKYKSMPQFEIVVKDKKFKTYVPFFFHFLVMIYFL